MAVYERDLQDLRTQMEQERSAKEVAERKIDRLKLVQNTDTAPAPSTHPEHISTAQMSSTEPLGDAAHLAERHLQEIESLKQEKYNLLVSLDSFKVHVGSHGSWSYYLTAYQANTSLPDDRVRESSLFRSAEGEIEVLRVENQLLKNRLDKVLVEYEELQSERRKFVEQLESEELSRRKVLENEIRKLSDDLTRVRANRDNLQHSLELRSSKDEAEIVQNEEIRMIANTRKDRITALESTIQRLKLKSAASMSESFLLEFFNENPEGNPLKHLKEKLEEAENANKELSASLAAFDQLNHDAREKHQLLKRERELMDEVQELKRSLSAFDAEGNLNGLRTRIRELEVKVDYYQKSETRLIGEIEAIGKAWADLEQQSLKKVLNLTEKEDQILRLLAENTVNSNLTIALKRQSEKQLEQIRKMEEREKVLHQQLQTLEKDLSAKTITADLHRRKVSELNQRISEMSEKVEKYTLRLSEMDKVIKEKVKQIVDEADAKRRLAEQLDSARRKIDSLSRADSSMDSAAQKEIESYK
ncbi:hypothetical protein HK405_004632, partial [Cladochytrium tenue]